MVTIWKSKKGTENIMKKFRSPEMKEAYELAGYREKYAMEHGNKSIVYVNDRKCFKFTYSEKAEYQDANGALYDTIAACWIG